MLIHNTIPVTLYDILLKFRDTIRIIELKGDLLKMITNKNYNVDLPNLAGRKSLDDFAKKMYFDMRAPDNESTWDRKLIKKFEKTIYYGFWNFNKVLGRKFY